MRRLTSFQPRGPEELAKNDTGETQAARIAWQTWLNFCSRCQLPKLVHKSTEIGRWTHSAGRRPGTLIISVPASQGLCGVTHRAQAGAQPCSRTPKRNHRRAPQGTLGVAGGSLSTPYACSQSSLIADTLPHIYSYDAHSLVTANKRPFFWTLPPDRFHSSVRPENNSESNRPPNKTHLYPSADISHNSQPHHPSPPPPRQSRSRRT